jgi:hypothetical protein
VPNHSTLKKRNDSRVTLSSSRNAVSLYRLESSDSGLTREGGGHIAFAHRYSYNRKSQLRTSILFAVIRHYHFNPKDSAEIDRRVRDEFVPHR